MRHLITTLKSFFSVFQKPTHAVAKALLATVFLTTFSFSASASIVGDWKLAPVAGAMGVGGSQGNTDWWANDDAAVTERACLFDDVYALNADGSMSNDQGAETWLEGWQEGQDGESCGAPIAPHDGSNAATYSYDATAGTLTIVGQGAYMGLAKGTNQGENGVAADNTIVYQVTELTATTMTLDLNYGNWWRFKFVNEDYVAPAPVADVNVTFSVDMSAVDTNADGVYLAGGGFGQDGHLLTDDGNDIWSITLPLAANQQYAYKFRNQPSYGTWDGFESADGLVAGGCNVGQYNDRFVDVADADLVIPVVAYGSCTSTPFVSSAAPVSFTVTAADASEVKFHSGAFGWDVAAQLVATNNQDGTWTATIDPGPAAGLEYKWWVDGTEEDLSATFRAGNCATDNVAEYSDTYFNRTWALDAGDVTGDVAGACSGTNAVDTPDPVDSGNYNVTFSVDMTGVDLGGETPTINGTFNGWCGSCNPLTDSGNGVWTTTISLPAGDIDYKFTLGAWVGEETVGADCVNSATNRFLTIGNADLVAEVTPYGGCADSNGDNSNVGGELSLEGSWRLAPEAGALGVGPSIGDTSWWSNSAQDVNTRSCLFDDVVTFGADGSYTHAMGDATWLEGWQEGQVGESCGAPIAPQDGSNAATYSYDATAGTITVVGEGAHIGLSKVTNQGEDGVATDNTIVYQVTASSATSMTLDVAYPAGYWRYKLVTDSSVAAPTPPGADVNVTFQVDMSAVDTNADGVYLAGGGFGQDGHLLTDDGNDVWSITLPMAPNQQYAYKFRNRPANGTWDGFEDQAGFIDGGCGIGQYNDRFVNVADADLVIPVVAYGSCTSTPFVSSAAPVSFTVTAADASEVKFHSSAFGWDAAAQIVAVDNNDGTWTATMDPGPTDGLEYKWIVDGVEEDLKGTYDAGNCANDNVAEYSLEYYNRTWALDAGNVTGDVAGACSGTNDVVTLDISGDWRVAPVAGGIAVGPSKGDTSWWSIPEGDISVRHCFFDDVYSFNNDDSFSVDMGGQTWLEDWQEGVDAAGCGTPVAPHDGSNPATYAYDATANTLTVTGDGAFVGLAKVVNGGEDGVSGGSITYEVSDLTATSMTLDISYNDDGAYWRFLLVTADSVVDGCTDSNANNFDASATSNDGSCTYDTSSSIDGDWRLAPEAGALAIGPSQGSSQYWSNSAGDVNTRYCLFDDVYSFANGSFTHTMGDATWLEDWQDGVDAEGCGAPIAPHDGSAAATYTYADGTLTVTGNGAHIGLAKARNGGEDGVSGGSVAYIVSQADETSMTLDIDVGGNWWRFKLVTDSSVAAPTAPEPVVPVDSLSGDWRLAPQADALGVGPNQGDTSWWSIGDGVDTRYCLFDDVFSFNEDGSFAQSMGGNTWLETWQGVEAEGCGAPVAPHDGSNAATFAYDADASTLTIVGEGAHVGLAKVTNQGEDGEATDNTIVYQVTELTATTMTLDVNFGNWWRFKLVTADSVDAPISPIADADGDGVVDAEDAFPNDPTETVDTDNDGIGNNADPDDDNDGVVDADDGAPLNDQIGYLPKQQVSVTGNPSAMPGKAVAVTVSYDVSNDDATLTGLGLNVHYDSSVLTFVDYTVIVTQDLVAEGGSVVDAQDSDNNSATDRYVSLGWTSLNGNWPGSLPSSLVTVNFTTAEDVSVESTPIGFSSTSNTAGYAFAPEAYDMPISAGSWDFDADGNADALTDGLLLLRYTFGLSGASLTDSAIASGSPLTAAEVEANVAASTTSFADIDGNGNVDALTDGLMLLRYLFGLSGASLIDSAVATGATRSTAADIEAYIQSLVPTP